MIIGKMITLYSGVILDAKNLKKYDGEEYIYKRYAIIEYAVNIFSCTKVIGSITTEKKIYYC